VLVDTKDATVWFTVCPAEAGHYSKERKDIGTVGLQMDLEPASASVVSGFSRGL